jgi:osmoprotectant transport system substrate-binding protein
MSSRARICTVIALTSVAVVLGLTACAPSGPAAPDPSNGLSVTIGSQRTVENRIISQIYGQVLAFHGYEVDYNLGIGNRKSYIAGLTDGLIDFIPEYSGSLLNYLDRSSRLTSTSSMVSYIPQLIEKRELELLEPSPAENGYALVVTKEFSEQQNLVNIGDLGPVAAQISFGATPEFETLSYGPAGLNSVYGVAGFDFEAIDDETGTSIIEALVDDDIQVAGVHASAPAINRDDVVVLGDPAQIIAAENVVPLIRSEVNTGDFAAIVNAVSAKLTTNDLRELNSLAASESQPTPESLARDWLASSGLLG